MSTAQHASPDRQKLLAQSDFMHQRQEILRLTDLDFQQHVNNAAITGFLANARFDFLATVRPCLPQGSKLVIARLEVDFTGELHYGFEVTVGTRIMGFGRTSMRLEQAIFQNDQCAAHAICVFVHKGEAGSLPWPESVLRLAASSANE